jgi:hypothetical protein
VTAQWIYLLVMFLLYSVCLVAIWAWVFAALDGMDALINRLHHRVALLEDERDTAHLPGVGKSEAYRTFWETMHSEE